jgi:4-amino-4-deoxy-L-arabinose transferase-like glycosyltransferase
LRLSHAGSISFEYDQEMVARKAWDIAKSGRQTLIGTRVGEYHFFTPPLYVYISALFAKVFSFHPLANFYQAYFWAFLSFISIYRLTKQLYGRPAAWVTCLLYSLSPLYLKFDRIPWNPDLLLFASVNTFYWLYQLINQKKFQLKPVFLLSLFIILAINSHFTAVFLVIIAVLAFIRYRQIKILPSIIILFSFLLLMLTPLLIFDLRHDFINLKGIWTLLTLQSNTGSYLPPLHPDSILFYFLNITAISAETASKVFFGGLPVWLNTAFGLMIAFLFFTAPQPRKLKFLAFLFLLVPVFIFSFYTGPKPEYYFLISSPAYLLLFAYLFRQAGKNWRLVCCLSLFFCFIFTQDLKTLNQKADYSLDNKMAVIENIKQQAGNRPVWLTYIIPLQWNFGFKYLADYYGLNLDPNSPEIYKLVYPQYHYQDPYNFISGDIGVIYPSRR